MTMEGRDGDSDRGVVDGLLLVTEPPKTDSVKVLAVFLLYSMAMFSIPFAAFFGTKYTLKHSFHLEGFANTAWSVVAAVVVINAIILMYACRGYDEVKEEQKREVTNQTSREEAGGGNMDAKKAD